MAADPVLVLQMQRMGDLILSFPLFLWLSRSHPGRERHVVAEELFFRPLMPLSPPVTYIPWAAAGAGALKGRRYRLILNLSIREEAARLAGALEADIKVGPVREADGSLRVRGGWQLYRAGLAAAGRHNRFHWADLNGLDVVSLEVPRLTRFDPPRGPAQDCGRVGVFVGASEPGKRPTPEFYAGLCRALMDRGLAPVLLGGPADRPVAEAVRAASCTPLADLTGRFSIAGLAEFGRSLSLMITPDTGPMHLAAWTGLPTLNLSVGHVSPWDTAPYQPGHLVLRSRASCGRGCWACTRSARLCERALDPRPVAAVAALAARGARQRLERLHLPGLDLFETARSPEGLFTLRRLGPPHPAAAADLAGEFWRRFFLWRLAAQPLDPVREAWETLAGAYPALGAALVGSLPVLGRGVARFGRGGAAEEGALWRGAAPFWAPLASWLEMGGRNADASAAWERDALALLERLAGVLAGRA